MRARSQSLGCSAHRALAKVDPSNRRSHRRIGPARPGMTGFASRAKASLPRRSYAPITTDALASAHRIADLTGSSAASARTTPCI